MKVLHLIDSGGLYGAENMLLALVREQVKQGLDPMILSAGDLEIDEKPIEAEAHRLRLPITPWRMKPGLNLREARKIQKWAREKGYQVLHSHGYKFNILMGLFPRTVRQLSLVSTLHGYVHAPRFSKMWLYELLDRIAIFNTQSVVLVGKAMRKELPAGIKKLSKLRVIPNGIDIEQLRVRTADSLCPAIEAFSRCHTPLLLGVGRLSPEKNFESLIEAFATFRRRGSEAGLIIVGEGRLRPNLEALVERHGLESAVLLPGYSSQVPALLARSDLLLMPSLTEGLPITLLEGMAVGVPVMVSEVGEMPGVLGLGQGGSILSDVTPDAIARELESFFSNVVPAQQVSWACQQIEQDYSAPAMAEKYRQLYSEFSILE
ncbi:glycosyltransferase involved in cell wall biosynthesis [Halospina denitrificans]|uniref:Glycosyltransferase involved in cell wall biosynthesis n=1 Tax=Halospina denitrificans TaxID=332522 RepID=A0A4R7JN19_9GAMM|nr:glycosyltransferase [Halospina denitrificans]TDT39472.1 glycosyltransferase involved in cell wall biosynthesis [Halospina denitrificans]